MSAPDPRHAPGGDRASSNSRTMLVAAAAVIVVVVVTTAGGLFVFAKQRPLPQPTVVPTLRGEAVSMGAAAHVTSAATLEITPGQPPVGGPHYAQPSAPGIYPNPIDDGNAIHSLEHGIIWITYRADLVSAADLETLRAVAQSRPKDVILSPRPGNSAAASVVSWGRRLNLATPVSRQALEAFVTANLDQSPEPGVR